MKKVIITICIILAVFIGQESFATYVVGWGELDLLDRDDFVAIAAGPFHSLALKSDGSIVGWGDNWAGEATPPDGNDFVAIAAGGGGSPIMVGFSLALKSDGSIIGWGDNHVGQATPPAGNDFVSIAAQGDYALALKSDGSVIGWGDNYFGQATSPEGNDYIAIATGEQHSLVLKSNGSIVGWGYNDYGQATPPDGNDFIAITAGRYHSLALKSNGSIVGWGANWYGQATPPEGNDFIAIAAGGYHSIALKQDGSIVAWGAGGPGQSGNPHYGQAIPPSGNNFVAISAGNFYSLALININPTAVVGPNQVEYAWIDGIAEVNLDGSASYDDDGDELTYRWTWSIDGNDYETNGVNPTIELPVGQHEIELIVNDGWKDSEPNYTVIDVIEPIKGNLWMTPRVINKRCGAKNILAMLQLPQGITRDQIDRNSKLLLYPGEIEAVQQYIWPYYANGVRHVSIFAIFDRNELLDTVEQPRRVQLDVVGQLKTGQYFFGQDNIRIINPYHRPWLDGTKK
jgi:hypothetical protein